MLKITIVVVKKRPFNSSDWDKYCIALNIYTPKLCAQSCDNSEVVTTPGFDTVKCFEIDYHGGRHKIEIVSIQMLERMVKTECAAC